MRSKGVSACYNASSSFVVPQRPFVVASLSRSLNINQPQTCRATPFFREHQYFHSAKHNISTNSEKKPQRMNMEAEAKSTGEEVKGLEQEEVERWEGMWTQDGGLKPGQRFDAERSSLALLHLIDTADPPLPKGRVLVPGCGRGYDLASFVKKGVATEKCVGLEISNSAINAAQHYLDQQLPSELRDKAEIRLHDFFKMHQSEEQERFDLIFDYTFLCAIPPQKRQDWAAQMKRLLKPDGELITLIFPVMEKEGGPPYAMSTELVSGLLKPQGFSLVGKIAPVPPHLSHAGREGKEWLARWAL